MSIRPFSLAVVARALGLAGAAAMMAVSTATAQLTVVSTSPGINAGNVPRNAAISVTFDRAVDPTSFTGANFKVFGKWTGAITAAPVFSNGNQTVTVTPSRPLMAGEQVMVIMSHNLRGADASTLRAAGYSLLFNVGASPSAKVFREAQRIFTRGPNGVGPQTRIYGGQASDLNGDGWADLTIVNEVSADIRVFMNLGAGLGISPTHLAPRAIPFESSPNEPADFNGDGKIDMVTSSNATNQAAILLGNGDGTFQAPALFSMPSYPRGFGIIDVDGDGDMDITCACAQGSVIATLINNGAGVFGAPTTFESGVGGEYGMCAADMDEDGILDLVVGGIDTETVKVVRGNGNGTFSQVGTARSCQGAPWVIVCGDVNGDGNVDVSTANSFAGNGAILLGNGDGTLQNSSAAPSVNGHCVATDLPDVDGDGDPDWVLSSFGAGTWTLYENNGAGGFSEFRVFDAPSNPACCLPFDFDNDGDVDLAMIDEIADQILLMRNVCPGDFNASGTVSVQDIFDFLTAYFGNDLDADVNGSGTVTVQDIFDFLTGYFGAC